MSNAKRDMVIQMLTDMQTHMSVSDEVLMVVSGIEYVKPDYDPSRSDCPDLLPSVRLQVGLLYHMIDSEGRWLEKMPKESEGCNHRPHLRGLNPAGVAWRAMQYAMRGELLPEFDPEFWTGDNRRIHMYQAMLFGIRVAMHRQHKEIADNHPGVELLFSQLEWV